MRSVSFVSASILAASAAIVMAGRLQAAPTVAAGYTLTTFASPFADAGLVQTSVPGVSTPAPMVSAPDDIAVSGGNVFIGWGNNVASDGGDGGLSTLAEYTSTGTLEKTFNIQGHLEGIAVDPATGLVYTDENEDGNSALTVVNTSTGGQTRYGYPNPAPHGGGFDGLQIINGTLYASGSNPDNGGDVAGQANGQVNSHPVIYQVSMDPNSYPQTATVSGVVWGNDPITGSTTGATLNVFDPDSLDQTPAGQLLLSNESGAQLTLVTNPASAASRSIASISLFNTANGNAPANTDETGFATSTKGTLLFADVKAGIVYALTANAGFSVNQAYSSDKTFKSLDALNLSTGALTPIVSGLGGPAGVAFIPDPVNTPEPAALGLIAVGALVLGLQRRRSQV